MSYCRHGGYCVVGRLIHGAVGMIVVYTHVAGAGDNRLGAILVPNRMP